MATIDLIQGDSLDLEIRTTDRRILTDFTCQLQVRDSSDVITGIDREIITYNTDETAFIARITTAESTPLIVGTYTLSAQLDNSTTSEGLEIPVTLNITKQFNF